MVGQSTGILAQRSHSLPKMMRPPGQAENCRKYESIECGVRSYCPTYCREREGKFIYTPPYETALCQPSGVPGGVKVSRAALHGTMEATTSEVGALSRDRVPIAQSAGAEWCKLRGARRSKSGYLGNRSDNKGATLELQRLSGPPGA